MNKEQKELLCNELDDFLKDVKKKIKEEDIFNFDSQICKRYNLNNEEAR